MPLPPSNHEVENMVRVKLEQQNPALYRELLASGQLDQVASQRAQVFDEVFSQVASDLMLPAATQGKPHEEKVRLNYQARDQATEQALAAALEFPPPQENSSQQA
jgi:hypothetical protein